MAGWPASWHAASVSLLMVASIGIANVDVVDHPSIYLPKQV